MAAPTDAELKTQLYKRRMISTLLEEFNTQVRAAGDVATWSSGKDTVAVDKIEYMLSGGDIDLVGLIAVAVVLGKNPILSLGDA